MFIASTDPITFFFAAEVFTGGFTTEADFGMEILRVSATDLDADHNAKLTYFIRKPVKSTLVDGEELVGPMPFVIDKETGTVSLNFDPQRDMKGYFELEVLFEKCFLLFFSLLIIFFIGFCQ